MTLDRLLRRFRPAVLGLSLTLSPVYSLNCGGGEEKSAGCQTDQDCKGDDRVCDNSQCVYRDGKGDSGSSEEGPCGNSPLNGKYLWTPYDCDIWTERLNDTCKGLFIREGQGNIDIPFTYDGLVIYKNNSRSEDGNLEPEFELVRQFPCSLDNISVKPFSNENELVQCDKAQCALSKKPQLYAVKDGLGGKVFVDPETFFLVTDEPWPGTKELCRVELERASWYTTCFLNDQR